MERNILHLDLDTFFVSVERLLNSKLAGKPVIVGGFSSRSVVSSCSYECRKFGVHAGMPVKLARTLCNEAILIRGDMDTYSKYSNMITDIIHEKAPVYEKMSIDEHYLDLTGMDRFFGCMTWAHELRHYIIQQTGLPISMGLSLNKTVSKIATGEAKPNGELEVPKDHVLSFLFPLSIQKIPGVGEKTYRLLRTMGISTIESFVCIPLEMIKSVLGENGVDIWKKANGIDLTPVKPYTEQQSISTERTFDQDTIDYPMLKDLIVTMTEKLGFQLRQHQKLTSCVTVKIRYANFDTHTQQRRISYTSLDHNLISVAKDLFEKVYQRRMLVRLVGVKFSNMVYGFQQLDLFDANPALPNLYRIIDNLKSVHGHKIIRRAVAFR